MGEVEQYRMQQDGPQLPNDFVPNVDVEWALKESVQTALNNQKHYYWRKAEYERAQATSRKSTGKTP